MCLTHTSFKSTPPPFEAFGHQVLRARYRLRSLSLPFSDSVLFYVLHVHSPKATG